MFKSDKIVQGFQQSARVEMKKSYSENFVLESKEDALKRKRIRLAEEEKARTEEEEQRILQSKKLKSMMDSLNIKREKLEKLKQREHEEEQFKIAAQLEAQAESKKIFKGAPCPDNEVDRVMALRSYRILDTEFDPAFDSITQLTKDLLQAPISTVSLVETHRLWFKSIVGLDAKELCRNTAFCSFTVAQDKPLIVLDALEDDRFKTQPLVCNPPHIRFYAGAQLRTKEGLNLGTLCVSDFRPRTKEEFGDAQVNILTTLAKGVVREMELFKALAWSRNSESLMNSLSEFSCNALANVGLDESLEVAVVNFASVLQVDSVRAIKLGDEPKVIASFGDIDVDDTNTTLVNYVKSHITPKSPLWVVNNTLKLDNVDISTMLSQKNIMNALYAIIYYEETPCVLLSIYRNEKPAWWSSYEIQYVEQMSKLLTNVVERSVWEQRVYHEKHRADTLLENILPKSIVRRMTKKNETNIADGIACASVLFADIVGFTEMSQTVSPSELVEFLNSIFSDFDRVALQFGCEKVKTIGDCYLAAAGLLSHEDDHSSVIVDFALAIIDVINSDKYKRNENLKLNMRVGVNTGNVVAGVIGSSKFIYDLWGDTVNTASRMESHGISGCVHISQNTYLHLGEARNKYVIQDRGTIKVKGKGEMHTYIVQGKQAQSKL